MNTNFRTPTHEAQATKEYNEVSAECTELLRRISDGLNKYGGANLSWGTLGSVKHSRDLLIQALFAVGGLTQEEIEKYHI